MPFAHPDWFSVNVPNWRAWLAHLVGKPWCDALEIGSFEGRSALWLLENVLTHDESRLVCVDPYTRESMEASVTRAVAEAAHANFEANLAPFRSRVDLRKRRSCDVLHELEPESFDLVYIDGSHLARDVLYDAAVSWRLVKPGGTMIFDDYEWTHGRAGELPKIAIDAFLTTMQPHLELVGMGLQVCVRKRR